MKLTLLALTLGLASLTLSAKPSIMKQAKDAGVAVTCSTCHNMATPKVFTGQGQYLLKRKAADKAKDVDGAWLKNFK